MGDDCIFDGKIVRSARLRMYVCTAQTNTTLRNLKILLPMNPPNVQPAEE